MTKVLVFSDHQAPHQDKDFHRLSLEYIDQIKPDRIIVNGDLFNFDSIKSKKYHTDVLLDESVKSCLEAGHSILRDYRLHAYTAQIDLIPGNHEQRWHNLLVGDVPMLIPLSQFSLPEVANLSELNVNYITTERGYGWPQASIWLSPYCEISHGWLVRSGSAMSAKATLEYMDHSFFMGHTHRIGMVAKTVHGKNGIGTIIVVECGTMAQIGWGLGYTRDENWQSGFVEINVHEDGRFGYKSITWVPGKKELLV